MASVGQDTTPPMLTCPDSFTRYFQEQATRTVTYPPATASDNSGGAVSLSYSQPSGLTFNVGDTTVTVTGIDPSGNSDQCEFNVTVIGMWYWSIFLSR